MAQPEPFKLPKLIGLENAIPEFDGTIAKYKEWRDTVERAFLIKGITTLMIFGRYWGNTVTGYTRVDKGHDGSGDAVNHQVAEFVVNFNRQVFAIIATKLKGTALSSYKTNEARANCWWRSNINNDGPTIATLKDIKNYPVALNFDYTANNWHATARASGFKNRIVANVANSPNANIVQVGFREIFDEQFITETVQETYQQQFLKYKFMPNWNDENSYDKYRQRFEELRVLANYQYAANFKSGPYTDYKLRLPPEMKERLTFQSGLGAITTEADFWQQTSAIFHSIRQNKVDSGKAQTDLRINRFQKKETSTKKFKRINNVDTTRRNDKRNDNCFNCNQPGHYARNCPLQRKKESFNRIETQRNSQGKFIQKIKYCSICENARLHHSRNCQRNNKYSYNGKFGKGPVPMALNKIKTNYSKDKRKNYNRSYNKNYRNNKPPFRKKVHNVKESKPSGSNNFQRKTKVQHLEDIEEETEEEYEYYSQGEEEYESEEEKPKIRNVVTTKDFRNKKNYF
ncbi:hypothetical protein F8M41_017319 [Gigaspora margarita]|uniref:CCHC-type domain-containing protein n=1 Tax=Gigaspora margarita TaxID=4874 RepID=A0A8H4ANC8_GIGMA|nr:hypothetical protein F8M41_017319 [Gigaspora margarita]